MGKSNCYLLFCGDNRKLISKQNPTWSNSQVTSKLGELWRNLNQNEKDKYTKLAIENNTKFKKENPCFKAPVKPETKYQSTFKIRKVNYSTEKLLNKDIMPPSYTPIKIALPSLKRRKDYIILPKISLMNINPTNIHNQSYRRAVCDSTYSTNYYSNSIYMKLLYLEKSMLNN